ncbi:MAG: SAM-dependent methyltransferase, partial [Clostridiales bacterium]|nr:SAM-dependent methyltransferase [Clostridiales bacterium]
GEDLGRICYEEGIEVTSLPGASACVTALTLSGLPTRRFAFEAFLPRDKKERAATLAELKDDTRTLVIYEAPHHLLATLKDLLEALGDRRISLCRELTKKYETVFRTNLAEAVEYYEANGIKGECVIVMEGRSREELILREKEQWEQMTLAEHMDFYISSGMDKKEAMKQVAKDRGVAKSEIYRQLLADDDKQ